MHAKLDEIKLSLRQTDFFYLSNTERLSSVKRCQHFKLTDSR